MKKFAYLSALCLMPFLLAGCLGQKPTAAPAEPTANQAAATNQAANSGPLTPTASPTDVKPGNEQFAVTIKNLAFNPKTITIKAGDMVIWTNQDEQPHNIKASLINSPKLNTSESFQYIFTEKGTYDYTCGLHPNMAGQIIVE